MTAPSPLKVGVLMGGISAEHDISLESGLGMLARLDTEKFTPFPVIISRGHHWYWPASKQSVAGLTRAADLKAIMDQPPEGWHCQRYPDFEEFPSCDIMLLALHGKWGEDGTLQKFLDERGQKYTGSGASASALAMDKLRSKEAFKRHGIPTPGYRVLTDFSDKGLSDLTQSLPLPLVIKIPDGGSSIGVDIARSLAELKEIVERFSADTPELLIEEFVAGKEATCGFLAGGPTLWPTEIVPQKDAFFNLEAKYDSTRTQEITPARFKPEILAEIQALAQKCHQCLGLEVYSRTDFLLGPGGLRVIEVNSLPGFTPNSLLPKGAAAAGLDFKDLLTKIISESLKK